MTQMDLKKNSVMWDGEQEGFFEAFYIQCNDPVSGMAWWLRYSVMIPKKGRGLPYAAVLAVQFDPSGALGPIAMKHVYPVNHFHFEKDRFILYIEDGFITNSHATGKIRHGDRSLSWDIQWVPSDECFLHYPEFLYGTSFPTTKVTAPHWATTGSGFIRWNDGEFFLEDALIHVGHLWGTSHAKKWAWAHSHGFTENESAVFEGLWAPILGPLGVSVCAFKIDGVLNRFTSLGWKWPLKKFLRNNEWKFKLNNSKYKIDGLITVDPTHVAGVAYHDPLGSRRFCYNSKIATIRMDVHDKKNNDKLTLNAPNTAAFEVALPKELSKFSILV